MAKDDDKPQSDNPFGAIRLGNNPDDQTQTEDYGSYLFGNNYQDDPFAQADPGKEPWSSTMRGRSTIRLFSRGIMGAGLYTVGQYMISKQMPGYNRSISLRALGEHTLESGEIAFSPWRYPLRYIARGLDVTVSKPIKAMAKATVKDERAWEMAQEMAEKHAIDLSDKAEAIAQVKNYVGDNAIWFRGKKHFAADEMLGFKGGPQAGFGRSLGDEMVGLTFDFAMGSVGDAWGRNIAQICDPNVQKPWRDKEGHLDFAHFGKATAQSGWRILSKNQGEDWAAALPYVYQCRFQRQALSNAYKGFKLTADMQQNGGATRVDAAGNIIDSYAKAGALDLQMRFTGYNWYTLMFRDMYDNIANGLRIWKDNSYKLPSVEIEHDPLTSTVHGAGFTVRYATKSAIKAFIYMTPAVPFFWMFRTPQTKTRGIAIYTGDGTRGSGGAITSVPVPSNLADRHLPEYAKHIVSAYENPLPNGGQAYIRDRAIDSSGLWTNSPREVFDRSRTRGALDAALNPFGRLSYDAGKGLFEQIVDPIAKAFNGNYKNSAQAHAAEFGNHANEMARLSASQTSLRGLTHTFADASAAYTPYMIAKAETALKWNNKDMDTAIYRFLDGVTSFQVGEVRGGLSDMRDMIIHPKRHGTPSENGTSITNMEEKEPAEGEKEAKEGEAKPQKKVEGEGAETAKLTKGKQDPEKSEAAKDNVAWAAKEQGKQKAMKDLLDGRVTIH